MQITNKKFRWRSGANWTSFEKFRLKGAEALSSIANGVIATLQTKTGQYRIIEERDFQEMYGLASDVDRLRGGLRFVLSGNLVWRKTPFLGCNYYCLHPQPSAAQNGYDFAASAPQIGDFRKSAIVIPLLESRDFFGYSPENKLIEGNALECRQFFSFLL
jgi:hypothetical protein